MASISAELQQIRSASLARDVRSSIATAIEKVNSNTSSGGGDSIDAVTTYYCASSSCTAAPAAAASWSTTKPTLSSSACYMWMKLRIATESGSAVDTPAFVVGNYNSRLSSVTVYYKLTNTTSTPATSTTGWSTSYSVPTASNQYLWCHIRLTHYAYGASSSHTVYSSVFRLATYQEPAASAVSGVVVNLDNTSDRTDTAIGDEIKASIQAGIMPVVYSAGKYAQVLKANPYSDCGTNYMTLYYPETGCSGFTMTSVDQRCS